MPEPVTAIRNIGPKSVAGFARAGLHTADEVRAIGAEEAYRRLIRAGTRPHFIGFYALVMGLQGRNWNDVTPEEKVELRAAFDALVAEAGKAGRDLSGIEAMLDRLGVRETD